MERITFDGNFCDIAMCQEVRGGPLCDDGDCSQRKVWYRLKAYEDSKLIPEELSAIRRDLEGGCLRQAARRFGIDVDRLGELAKADREGRLVVLPAATVFELVWDAGPGGASQAEDGTVAGPAGRGGTPWAGNGN